MPAANDRDSSSSLTGKAKSGAWTPTSTRLKFNDWGRVRHSSPSVRSMAVALVFSFNQKRCRSPPNKKHDPFTLSVPHVETPRDADNVHANSANMRPSLAQPEGSGCHCPPRSPQPRCRVWIGASWPLYAATQPTDAIDGVQRTLSNMRFPELTTSNYMKIWQNNRYRVLKYLPGFTCRSLAALWRAGSSSTFWHGIIPNRTWPKTFP